MNSEDAGPDHRPPSRWRELWRDFITSGHRVGPDHPDYLRVTVLNLVEGAGFFVWLLFLCLNLAGVFESSAARLAIDITGILVAVGVLTGLRAGAPIAVVAEIVHAFLFILLLGVAVVRIDNPLALTVPLIYPAVAFLLLDHVWRGSLWTLMMILSVNTVIFARFPTASSDWDVVDGALSVSVAMFFQAAVVALYVHNRKYVMNRLRALGEELSYVASHDPLTGLYNRRTFMETVERELSRRGRDRRLFAFLLFDIDRFKAYNDHYGHPRGDRLLGRIGKTTRAVFGRREDLIFRLGGEEFGVVYRPESRQHGTTMADRLLEAVEALAEPAPAGPRECVTVSAGLLLTGTESALSPDEVYRLTDNALYEAKESGRARWVLADTASGISTSPAGMPRL